MRARERRQRSRRGATVCRGARASEKVLQQEEPGGLGFSLNRTYAMRNGTMELTLKIAGVPVEEFVHAKETCALLVALPYHHQACDVPSSGL